MKRSSFKRPEYPKRGRVPLVVPAVAPKPRGCILRVDEGRARLTVPVPKAEKAKPGKRAPNREEAAWMDAITAYGCIVCRRLGLGFVPAAVHHILRGGRRMGHLHTISLCDPGHHQGAPKESGHVSRHPNKAQFERRYGTEAELLAALKAAIA